MKHCSLPIVPERPLNVSSPLRERLIRVTEKKWMNGTTLHYHLAPGDSVNQQMVREAFKVWSDTGIGLTFEEVTDRGQAEIRIGFVQDGSSWSYIGRDVISAAGSSEFTMNLGWDMMQDPRGVDVAVHEIGHTLGFPHSHQNPIGPGIVWDEPAVYTEFGRPPNNWPRQTTYYNIIRKLDINSVAGSEWDPNSIMHYAFGAGLIISPTQYAGGLTPEPGLSEADIAEVLKFYPGDDDQPDYTLWDMSPLELSLAAGEQIDLLIRPGESRKYNIGTFGWSDTVMVLFEKNETKQADWMYVTGDDDSGFYRNAMIQHKLYSHREYKLSIRLYSQYRTGRTTLLGW